jgi:hypothetical protein
VPLSSDIAKACSAPCSDNSAAASYIRVSRWLRKFTQEGHKRVTRGSQKFHTNGQRESHACCKRVASVSQEWHTRWPKSLNEGY